MTNSPYATQGEAKEEEATLKYFQRMEWCSQFGRDLSDIIMDEKGEEYIMTVNEDEDVRFNSQKVYLPDNLQYYAF